MVTCAPRRSFVPVLNLITLISQLQQTLGHSGFNVGGELGGFLSVAENAGLRLVASDSPEWRENFGGGGRLASMDELLASVITAEERAVIDANGGVRAVVLGKKALGRKS